MRKYLEKIIAAKQKRAAELREAIKNSEDVNEVRSLGDTLQSVLDELAEAKAQLDELDEPAGNGEGEGEGRNINVMATMQSRGQQMTTDTSIEYRKAFRDFIATGKKEKLNELRTAAGNTTGADNVGTIIPENLLNQIMEKLESLGTIYNLVTKTAYPVGQTIPREATKPVATWVGRNTETPASSTSGEGNGSTVGKTTLDVAISFTHFKLRCEVAMTEEVSQMALSSFEALFVKNVSIAMLRAIEFAIVDGDGYGMPTGILANTAPTGQAIEIAKTAKLDYKTLCDAEAAIPAEYEANSKWCMTKKTFMSFIGMVDSVGQPIARINYGINGKPERTLLGRDVILYVPQTGSHLGNYQDTVTSDTLFAFIYDFADYTLNNNYDLGIQHKIDWDNEDHRTKAVAAYDGKCIDIGSLVTLTKKSA